MQMTMTSCPHSRGGASGLRSRALGRAPPDDADNVYRHESPFLAAATGSKSRSPSFTQKFFRRPTAKCSSSLDSTMALLATVFMLASPSRPSAPSSTSTPALSAPSSDAVTPGAIHKHVECSKEEADYLQA